MPVPFLVRACPTQFASLPPEIGVISLSSKLTSKELVKKTVAAFEALQPLIEFINEALRAPE